MALEKFKKINLKNRKIMNSWFHLYRLSHVCQLEISARENYRKLWFIMTLSSLSLNWTLLFFRFIIFLIIFMFYVWLQFVFRQSGRRHCAPEVLLSARNHNISQDGGLSRDVVNKPAGGGWSGEVNLGVYRPLYVKFPLGSCKSNITAGHVAKLRCKETDYFFCSTSPLLPT